MPQASPPDGGYGWVVVASAFWVMGLTAAVLKNSGLFFLHIQGHYGLQSSATSWITACTVAMFHLGGPVASALTLRFSQRPVIICGGLLCSTGMILSALDTTLPCLYLSLGVLQGVGISFSWIPANSAVSHYFSRWRPVAYAVASSGECVFAVAFGPFFQWLIQTYGWRGALLVIGGLQLNICVCGALMRPLHHRKRAPGSSERAPGSSERAPGSSEKAPGSSKRAPGSSKRAPGSSERAPGSIERAPGSSERAPGSSERAQTSSERAPGSSKRAQTSRESACQSSPSLIALLKKPELSLYIAFAVLAAAGIFTPLVFVVPFAHSLGLHQFWPASVLSLVALADLTGRLACGWAANLGRWRTLRLLAVAVVMLGVTLMLLPVGAASVGVASVGAASVGVASVSTASLSAVLVLVALYGFLFGCVVAVHVTAIVDVVGLQGFDGALGLFMLFRSVGGCAGPPLAGLLVDHTGNYSAAFSLAGLCLVSSSVFVVLVDRRVQRRDSILTQTTENHI